MNTDKKLSTSAAARKLPRLVPAAAAVALTVGLTATPAAATPAPPIPDLVWDYGINSTSVYVQRHVLAQIPSAGSGATQTAVNALGKVVLCKRIPKAAPQRVKRLCSGAVSAAARQSLPVALARAKANGTCLNVSVSRGGWTTDDNNPEFCLRDVYGSIGGKWMDHGGRGGFLGYATTHELATPNKPGRFNHFKGGSIYWSPSTGAHEVHGAILEKWKSLGWENSHLGFPVNDETATPNRVGRFNHFQGGSIYWSPGTGAHEVRGAIRERWASLGWENSGLGFPTSDEHVIAGGGRRSTFENGCRIDWLPTSGAHAICTQVPTF